MDFSPPRGTMDLFPPRSEAIRDLYEAARRTAEVYGYRYIEVPAMEATELFARTSGESSDVVRKEMYTFKDRGGRMLTLRPEATASVVRAYLDNSHRAPIPFKAYLIAPMWRYGRPQAGRYREFRQFDLEVIGVAEAAADVEVIAVGDRYLRGLGFPRLGLELNSIGDEVCRPPYRRELVTYLEAHRDRLKDEHREAFVHNPLRVLDCKDEACRGVALGAPKLLEALCDPCRSHFESVKEGLAREAVTFSLRPTLVRGLDYYTRTTFEWVTPALSEGQNSIGGGGRYDGLAEVLGGPPTPGVGWALGLDRILLALEKEGVSLTEETGLDAFVVAVGEDSDDLARTAVTALREAGLSASLSFERRPLKAQLRMADRTGATFAAIVGQREARAGTVTLRRLSDGHQEEVGLDEMVAHVMTEKGKRS